MTINRFWVFTFWHCDINQLLRFFVCVFAKVILFVVGFMKLWSNTIQTESTQPESRALWGIYSPCLRRQLVSTIHKIYTNLQHENNEPWQTPKNPIQSLKSLKLWKSKQTQPVGIGAKTILVTAITITATETFAYQYKTKSASLLILILASKSADFLVKFFIGHAIGKALNTTFSISLTRDDNKVKAKE